MKYDMNCKSIYWNNKNKYNSNVYNILLEIYICIIKSKKILRVRVQENFWITYLSERENGIPSRFWII